MLTITHVKPQPSSFFGKVLPITVLAAKADKKTLYRGSASILSGLSSMPDVWQWDYYGSRDRSERPSVGEKRPPKRIFLGYKSYYCFMCTDYEYTDSQKHESTLLHNYVERIFDIQPLMYIKIFFEKNLIEVGSSHLYTSFGTFCVQIGQLFEAEWVFENCRKTVKSLFLKENDVDFKFFQKFKVSLRLE